MDQSLVFVDSRDAAKVLPLSAQASAIDGFDIVEVSYRYTTKDANKGVSKAAKLPKMVYLPSLANQLQSALNVTGETVAIREDIFAVTLNALSEQRTSVVKALIDNGSNIIRFEDVTCEVLIASMLAAKESTRLSKEKVEAWFPAMSEVIKALAEQRSAENGKPFMVVQAALSNAYKDACFKLTTATPVMSEGDRNKLVAMLEECAPSLIRDALIAKAMGIEYQDSL